MCLTITVFESTLKAMQLCKFCASAARLQVTKAAICGALPVAVLQAQTLLAPSSATVLGHTA